MLLSSFLLHARCGKIALSPITNGKKAAEKVQPKSLLQFSSEEAAAQDFAIIKRLSTCVLTKSC